jgi:trans-aconitate methyltransferase
VSLDVNGNLSNRLLWAVEALGVPLAIRILNVGCGHGVAVSLVCERLDCRRIMAIDRSPKMIAMAEMAKPRHARSSPG